MNGSWSYLRWVLAVLAFAAAGVVLAAISTEVSDHAADLEREHDRATALEAQVAALERSNTTQDERLADANARLVRAGQPPVPGPIGPIGAPGAPGAVGNAGRDGRDGADGAPGTPGATGPQGEPGEPGSPGADGQPGPAGPPGPAGADGKDGAPGADGQSAYPFDFTFTIPIEHGDLTVTVTCSAPGACSVTTTGGSNGLAG